MTISYPICYFGYDEIRPRSGRTRHSQVNPKYHHVVVSVAAMRMSHYLRILCNQARLDQQRVNIRNVSACLMQKGSFTHYRRVECSFARIALLHKIIYTKYDTYKIWFVTFWYNYCTNYFWIYNNRNRIYYYTFLFI